MDISRRGPLSVVEFVVIEFDARSGRLAVLGSMGYSASNRGEAAEDAGSAAAMAQERGELLSYTVVRIAAEETFPGE